MERVQLNGADIEYDVRGSGVAGMTATAQIDDLKGSTRPLTIPGLAAHLRGIGSAERRGAEANVVESFETGANP
jgi:hypothetical protein